MAAVLRISFLLILFFATSGVQAEERPFYAAIFGVTIDTEGNLVGFRVAEVIDTSTTPADIQLPAQYIAAARELVQSKNYPPKLENGQPKEFFTWFFYVPSQPSRADLDPTKMH